MPKYVAFLRAINVGGHLVKMDYLRTLFEALGFENVETFIASGNVIFDSKSKNTQALEKKIESLAELAINRQEPDYISSQIDQVASSMHETEKTMNELKFVTGVDLIEEPPPALLQETES